MFCPKCGANVQQGATFCPKCGTVVTSFATPVATPVAATPSPNPQYAAYQPQAQPDYGAYQPAQYAGTSYQQAQPAYNTYQQAQPDYNAVPQPSFSLPSFKGIGVPGIISRVAAVMAIVFLFLPWLNIPALQYASGYIGALGIKVKADWSIPDIKGLLDTFESTIRPYMNYMSNEDLAEWHSISTPVNLVYFVWLAVVIALVVGIVVSLLKKRNVGPLVAAGFAATLLGIASIVFVAYANSELVTGMGEAIASLGAPVDTTGSTALVTSSLGAYLTIVSGIVTSACALLDRGATAHEAQSMAYLPATSYQAYV